MNHQHAKRIADKVAYFDRPTESTEWLFGMTTREGVSRQAWCWVCGSNVFSGWKRNEWAEFGDAPYVEACPVCGESVSAPHVFHKSYVEVCDAD